MALGAGSIFAEYTILRLLGSGGMGKVYLAQHPRLPRRDAMKIIRRSLSRDSEYRERFRREAEAAATLAHPSIVGVYDRGEYRGRLWITMEFIDGDSAAQLIRRRFPGGMPAHTVRTIVTPIADALDYAHRQGVVHRDVKPSNILVADSQDGEPRVVLADFGIARQLNDPSGLTASNLALGTIAYAAPEQLMGSAGLSRADQYALAATTFHLLTGAPPFPDDNPVTVISQHLNTAPPRLSDRLPELEQLDDVLCTALAKDPDDRFRNCSEFVQALAERLGDCDADSATESSTVIRSLVRPKADTVPGTPPRRLTKLVRLAIVLPIAVGAAVAAVAVVPHLLRDSRPDAAPATDSTPAGAATPAPPVAAPPEFDGTYRVDANRSGEKYNGVPNPQPPNVSTWWAVRSTCKPSGCTATGMMLDGTDHRTAVKTPAAGDSLVLDFTGDSWRSRPQTQPAACIGPDGQRGTQTTTQVLSLQPTIQGVLHGAMVATVQTNECGQRGAEIWVPVVATRFGDVPENVAVPEATGDGSRTAGS
ncbi:MAG TPA: serine/threonine-protein kinase [Mycobacterium sp.]|nr:serine/threonine-protein kinase [Mycobacterium sp.]